MKLSEALILRADCQKRIEQLKVRLANNAKRQEGEKPQENPISLIEELENVFRTLVDLIKKINKTNSATAFAEGKTLMEALAERDTLMARRNAYSGLASAASIVQNAYSRSEIKFVSAVDVTEIQKRVDDLSKQHRELDARIQAANWQTELVD